MVENLLRKKGQIPQQMNLAVSRAVVFGGPLYIASPTVPAATSFTVASHRDNSFRTTINSRHFTAP